MSFLLGLTGSIGMGKSTTARLFAEAGCAVWDADAAVHRLYEAGGPAVEPIGDLFPGAVIEGRISRDALREIISSDPAALKKIEAIVHPLVGEDRAEFIRRTSADVVVLDIPLLFETGGDARVDAVVCVSVPPDVQEDRVMARGTMSLAQFQTIRDKQMDNTEKCRRADFVVVTDTLEHARSQVHDVLADIRKGLDHA